MERPELEELCQREKAQTLRLMEVSDLTRQIAQAAARNDQVSVTMLLSMREEPLQRLREMRNSLQEFLLRLPEPSAIRARELLDGAEAASEEEQPLCQQAGQFRRLLESVMALDRQVSLRMGGKRSFYRTFRE